MSHPYHIENEEPKAKIDVAAERLTRISELLAHSKKQTDKNPGRNMFTRAIDSTLALMRKYLPPLHWLVIALGRNGYVSLRAGGRIYHTARLNWQLEVAKYSGALCSGAVAP